MRTLITGLGVGESPRWHDGRLWFSNWVAQEVVAAYHAGRTGQVVTVEAPAPGAGWP